MKHTPPRRSPSARRRRALPAAAAAVLLALLATGCAEPGKRSASGADAGSDGRTSPSAQAGAGPTRSGRVVPPPAHAGFDYQIGGAYRPPAGVRVVTRDRTDPPAKGLYNVCYVNAFQAQPGAEGDWAADLLLRDAHGAVVYDRDWGEALLDIRSAAKRRRIAAKVGGWIDGCAAKGYQAVEPDNYDSYSRSDGLLTSADAEAYAALLSARAHADGLAAGQKNAPELAGDRSRTGLDFAVAEECGAYDECGDYTAAFGDRVLVVEYTARGLEKACRGWGGRLSVVRRDLDVLPAGSRGYVRATC